MKTIYLVGDEEEGEVEGMFDDKGNIIHCWTCNDANWRNEYFDPLMEALGIKVECSEDEKLKKKLRKAMMPE